MASDPRTGPSPEQTQDFQGPGADTDTTGAYLPAGREAAPAGARQIETRTRFTLLRPHAAGGLGVVSLARDEDLGRDVALKEIRPEVDRPDARQRFLIEAAITGQLEHPGTVPIYAVSRDSDGRPCYAMRFIHGRTLKETIAELWAGPPDFTSLAFRNLLQRFVAICQTVAYAHARGVVHRDLKPVNVMLGEYGETLVVDWGLAKRLGDPSGHPVGVSRDSGENPAGMTGAGEVVGTLAYMPPEQANAEEAGPAADVFALGATLYEILTGGPPYSGKPQEALALARAGKFPPPSARRGGVPAALEAVCLEAMRRTPDDRYPSALELSREVERWLADEPVRVYREPLPVRLARWGRRHRSLVAGGAVLLLTVCLALVIGLVVVRREQAATEAQRQQAVRARDEARANFRMARDAVDNYCRDVSEQLRGRTDDQRALRKQLLASAAEFYDRFVARDQDDPDLAAEQARAYGRLAFLLTEIGEDKKALEKYERARALFTQLVAAQPALVVHREGLGKVHDNLMSLHRDLGQFQAAEEAGRESLRLRQEIVRDAPADAEAIRILGHTQKNLGGLFQTVGRFREAADLYADAIANLEKHRQLRPNDSEGRMELGLTHVNLGVLRRDALNDLEGAEKEHREALPLLTELAREKPASQEHRFNLSVALLSLSNTLRAKQQWEEAEKLLRRALELSEEIQREAPSVPDYRQNTARTLVGLGLLCYQTRRLQDAETAIQKSLDIREKLIKEHPRVEPYRTDQADGWTTLGNILRAEGRLDDAVKAFSRAIEITEKLAVESPAVSNYPISVMGNSLNLGNLLLKQRNDPEGAHGQFDRAVRLAEAVTVEHIRKHPKFQEVLRYCYWARADARGALGRHAEAVGDWDRARELEPAAKMQRWFRYQRAISRARSGAHAEAVTEAEAIAPERDRNASFILALVCARAAEAAGDAALSEQYAVRAVKLLEECRAQQGFGTEEDRARLGTESHLAPLRGRKDFQTFVRSVQ